eukprot:s3551_g4.t1
MKIVRFIVRFPKLWQASDVDDGDVPDFCFFRSADTMISGRIGDQTRNSLSPLFLKTIFRDICAYAKGTCCRVQRILNFAQKSQNLELIGHIGHTFRLFQDISTQGHLQFVQDFIADCVLMK